MKYRIVRNADIEKGFDGYNWIEVPNCPAWPKGGYFDGRGQQYATVFATREIAEERAKQIGEGEVLEWTGE